MKRTALLFSILLVFSLLAASCAPAAAPAVPATATTAPTATAAPTATLAATATPAAAQKIISLAPSNTEILFALGAGAQVIARDEFSNYPDAATKLQSIGGSMGKYDLEKITSLQPDLILASPLNTPDQIKSFETATKNVVVIPNPNTLDDLYANLELVGRLTGHQADAEKLVASLKDRAKAVTDKLAGVTDKPKVFYELDATDPSKPWTAGKGSFIDLLISLAGGQNVAAKLEGSYAQMSQEELIVQNPDYILLGDALYGGIKPEQVAARAGWDAINAVKNNHVLAFNDDLVSRPGPRLIDGLEAIAKILHPDLFK